MQQIFLTDVVKNLLIINVLCYFAFRFAFPQYYDAMALHYIETADFRPYQFVTYSLMHSQDDFFHLVFNMWGLVSFGTHLEAVWKPKRFLFYYLFCGIGAAVFSTVVDYIRLHYFGSTEPIASMVGASGALYGVMIATAYLFPMLSITIFPFPFPITMRNAVLLFAAVAIWQGFGNSYGSNIAHLAHLGGFVAGAGLIIYWRIFGSRLS
jgi:membrane associated rhomboid family serine protease